MALTVALILAFLGAAIFGVTAFYRSVRDAKAYRIPFSSNGTRAGVAAAENRRLADSR